MAVDRKALIRQYKETRRPAGVFRVRNTANGKSLVGTSVDLPSMLNRQRAPSDVSIFTLALARGYSRGRRMA